MRRAFAAGVAFVILMVLVVVRCGFRHAPPERPAQPIADAPSADAAVDSAPVEVDAAPPPKPHAPKRPARPTRPPSKPPVTSPPKVVPVIPTPVIPPPVRPRCTHPANPGGCPALEPNINHPCDAEGVHCVYGPSCCPPVYVCNEGVFEAWFTHCP